MKYYSLKLYFVSSCMYLFALFNQTPSSDLGVFRWEDVKSCKNLASWRHGGMEGTFWKIFIHTKSGNLFTGWYKLFTMMQTFFTYSCKIVLNLNLHVEMNCKDS